MTINDCIYDLYHCTLKPTYYLGNSIYICKYKPGKINLRAAVYSNQALLLLQGYEQFGYILNWSRTIRNNIYSIELCLDPLYYNARLDKYSAPFSRLFGGSAIVILDNKDWINNHEFKTWVDAMSSSDAEIRRAVFSLVFKSPNRVPVTKFVKDADG